MRRLEHFLAKKGIRGLSILPVRTFIRTQLERFANIIDGAFFVFRIEPVTWGDASTSSVFDI